MSTSVIRGADVKLYIGGKLYPEVQSISYTIEYMENEIYGIDSIYPQEIKTDRIAVRGTVQGIRIKLTGGLQAYNIRPRLVDILGSPYVSLEVKDRHTDVRLFFLPQMKVTSETNSVASKGVMRVSFKFKGIVPYGEMDFSNS